MCQAGVKDGIGKIFAEIPQLAITVGDKLEIRKEVKIQKGAVDGEIHQGIYELVLVNTTLST